MGYFLAILSIFWLIRETKAILFWLYLWQLKEYRIGRFLDHFRTTKGQQLLFNKLLILKILLLFFLWGVNFKPWLQFGAPFFLIFFLLLYFCETVKGVFDFLKKSLKIPVWTVKTIFLISVILLFTIFYCSSIFQNTISFIFYLLSFDILTPAIVSAIVFLFQPLTTLLRNQIIRKAIKKREQFKNLLVIGITGSYGKTSTKEFLATILSKKFNVLKTKEHQNTEIGVSQCILQDLKEEHEIFVCEMGAYKKGEIKLLCDIAKPKIGILTGINEQHMATYGSQANIIRTKFELIQALPEHGLAILNDSDPKIKNEKLKIKNYNSKLKNIRFYSVEEKLDIWVENIKTEKDSISFKVFSKDGDMADFKVNVLGAHNVLNILGAVAVAKELGMNLQEISRGIVEVKPQQSGMQLKKGIGGLNIIDASYSANPDGVISHLEYLKIWSGKKIIIMPCLIELGKATIEVHQRIGQKIAEICNLAIITTKERFKEIKEEAGDKAIFIENPKEIFEKIKTFCSQGDVILLESRVQSELIKELII